MSLTPQPSPTPNILPLDAARAKQLNARRKMQSLRPRSGQALPNQQPRTELPNINWHDHYLMRVAK